MPKQEGLHFQVIVNGWKWPSVERCRELRGTLPLAFPIMTVVANHYKTDRFCRSQEQADREPGHGSAAFRIDLHTLHTASAH